ncbi:MAG: DUF4269 domain-containing protein [Paraclostridium sordellii]|uniref:DUF4269 domain-containing protein n=1 Tax=Paraclostridium sordellii TaxID=1505 RepID=UPI0005E0D4E0|nr:DUF4269 domain-containing protein [Paeniclostridium sordellii]CEN92715.1 Uncharacterised protein [[Clostridium] sordellii] [Paeniclostridium sordellii]CEN96488.1 Uncharacterised protein [[Clostridium] sordellii] [Paeniclostridium sordellii]
MANDFFNIGYLRVGNDIQKLAYELLNKINIFDILKKYNPILVGTIPIEINIENSDLDIICEVYNIAEFKKIMKDNFSNFNEFKINKVNDKILVINFIVEKFEIEVYAQNLKSINQNGYKHMIIENRILSLGGAKVRDEIIYFKKNGLKTEPAFAKILGLNGNPYDELLKIDNLSDTEIRRMLKGKI